MTEPSSTGVQAQSPAECLRLPGSQPIGTLVFHQGGLPIVRLVNFVVDPDAGVPSRAPGGSYAMHYVLESGPADEAVLTLEELDCRTGHPEGCSRLTGDRAGYGPES